MELFATVPVMRKKWLLSVHKKWTHMEYEGNLPPFSSCMERYEDWHEDWHVDCHVDCHMDCHVDCHVD